MLKFEVRAAQEKPHDPQNTKVCVKIAFCFFRGQIYEAQNSEVIQKHIRELWGEKSTSKYDKNVPDGTLNFYAIRPKFPGA